MGKELRPNAGGRVWRIHVATACIVEGEGSERVGMRFNDTGYQGNASR